MFRHLLEQADIAIFAEISLTMFLGIFVVVVIRAVRHTRQEIDTMSHLPLAGDEAPVARGVQERQTKP